MYLFSFFPIFILILLLIPDLEFKNIFPVLADGIMPPIKGAIVPGGWFSEFFLIIFLLPFFGGYEKGMKSGMKSVFAVMMTLIVVNLTVLFCTWVNNVHKALPLDECISIHQFGRLFLNM
ncbi:GerAB/ArcD/ProY family transporter [Peribacillus frigoritolerans]|nr:GerAB/ArcD/ProY family transporter [Peribacillus frigoritolerans]